MNLNQFTIKSQEAIQQAQQLATEMGNQAIEVGHLLKGILIADQNVTPYIFKKLGLNAERIEESTDSITSPPLTLG
ncbi:MAG: Clp protease N-terminal domain-containing protein [Vicingaceae bacterium]